MKKKRTFTKVLTILGIVLLIAAIALFVCGMTAADWDFKKLSTVHYIQKEFTAEKGAEIRSLTVRYSNADIEVRYLTGADCARISYPVRTNSEGKETAEIDAGYTDGALTLTEITDGSFDIFSWNLSSPAVIVELPADTVCSLDIRTGSGSVTLTGADPVVCTSVKIESENGNVTAAPAGGLTVRGSAGLASDNDNVTAGGLTADGKTDLQSDNGNVSAQNVTAAELHAETDNGNVILRGVSVSGALHAAADLGDVRLQGNVRAAEFSAETDTGDIVAEEGCLLGAGVLTLTCDLGDITVNGALAGSRNDYTLFLTAGTGSSNIPSGGSGAVRLTATTDTGDITLRFEK